MNNKHLLSGYILLCFVVLSTVSYALIKNYDNDHYTLKTSQGCCSIKVDYDDDKYTIVYTDNITPELSQTVIEYTEYDANWTVAEMMQDYCFHHQSNRGY
jgi:hypothetical protein